MSEYLRKRVIAVTMHCFWTRLNPSIPANSSDISHRQLLAVNTGQSVFLDVWYEARSKLCSEGVPSSSFFHFGTLSVEQIWRIQMRHIRSLDDWHTLSVLPSWIYNAKMDVANPKEDHYEDIIPE